MILLCGIPSETPMRLVRERLDSMDAEYVVFNQRHVLDCDIRVQIDAGEVRGTLRVSGHVYALESFHAIYTRLMDDRSLPEVADQPDNAAACAHCRAFHDTLNHWMEISRALVINRFVPMGSNSSKPYQGQLIRAHGFLLPETLVTSDPSRVREFHARHRKVIYKSLSSVRSIVKLLNDADWDRLERIRWCPTQFQGFVEGTNVRVHVIGERVYATAIATDATDYRYASRECGEPAALREVKLSEDLAIRCVNLAREMGLVLAGIDLKVTPDGRIYCFEVNPSPAYSYYENHTGQSISQGIAERLVAGMTLAAERSSLRNTSEPLASPV